MNKANEAFSVNVFCEQCGQVFWEDELLQWARELQKGVYIPEWFTKARLHEKETGHQVLVEYPNQTEPLKLREIYGVYY